MYGLVTRILSAFCCSFFVAFSSSFSHSQIQLKRRVYRLKLTRMRCCRRILVAVRFRLCQAHLATRQCGQLIETDVGTIDIGSG